MTDLLHSVLLVDLVQLDQLEPNGGPAEPPTSLSYERVEVAAARRCEKRVDDFPLAIEPGVGNREAPCTRRRARLASCRTATVERPMMGAISSKERSNMSCSTKATRSAGASVRGPSAAQGRPSPHRPVEDISKSL
jgi:hypothetical protein